MSLQINKVHHYQRERGPSGELTARLVKTNPYLRFSVDGGGTVFLQGGHFFYEGGDLCPDRPAWLLNEIRKASPAALRECGYNPDREKALQEQDAPPDLSKIRTNSEVEQPRAATPVRRSPVVRRTTHGSVNRG